MNTIIRLFAIEIYKVQNNVSTATMSELLEKRNLNCDLLSQTYFSLYSVNTNTYGRTSLKYFAGKV